jgi:hypothetical protein
MPYDGQRTEPARLSAPPWVLARRAMGSPRQMLAKLRGLGVALRGYGRNEKVEARLRRLRDLGYIAEIPNRIQRIVGAVDMLRFFIVPCAADYYATKGINFRFHTLLRFLDDPASMIDPTGFNSSRDAIIGHVMQVVHANPCYDFQLLETFEDGMPEMERQVEALLAGTHPRTESILAIVEDPDYHAQLLEHVRRWRTDHGTPPLLRQNVIENPKFAIVERTFGTVPNAMRYFAKLPRDPVSALRHLTNVREFPRALAVG